MLNSLVVALALTTTQGNPVAQPTPAPSVQSEPTAPLDARIAKDKATTQPLVVPQANLAPAIPAVHRIAGAATQVPCSEATFDHARQALARALDALRATQAPTGAWMEQKPVAATDQKKPSMAASTAVTALGLKAFAQAGLDPKASQEANRARRFVYDQIGPARAEFNPDPEGGLGNYVACAVVSGLAAVEDPSDLPLVERAIEWLTRTQWDQSEGVSPKLDWFGGCGYGKWGRPDLSNTQMMLDALHDAGVSPEDPAVQRALVFLTRTQNHAATNAAPWAQAGSNDGGFAYTPANGGESFASDAAGEGRYGEKMPAGTPRSLRSYGSMTYAGFKSLLFAGLSRDDPRVKAALAWISAHWTFAENPGLGQQGYYYYLHAMARALAAAQVEEIVDASGTSHNWRDELVEALRSRQRGDGSFVNATARWEESNADLCTIYAALALEEAIKPSPKLVTAR
jgi:squalene-hopene/tetraprenyl-beta-curcumene cyclase